MIAVVTRKGFLSPLYDILVAITTNLRRVAKVLPYHPAACVKSTLITAALRSHASSHAKPQILKERQASELV
jgi:hypothetical protein